MPSIPKLAIAVLTSLAAVSAFAQATAIPDAYDMHDAADADAAAAMENCIGRHVDTPSFAAAHARPGNHGRGELTASRDPRGAVVASGPFWACVAFSPEGFPVWPVEALAGAVIVRGVEPAVQADWSRKVLAQAAREGEGRGLVILTNGDGVAFNLIAEQRRATLLHYTSRTVPKAEIDTARFAAVIDDPHFTGITTVRRGGLGDDTLSAVFALPDARLRKPLDGEYVRERADDTTAHFDFAGTRWQFGDKAQDPALELLADGLAVETSGVGNRERRTTGSWRVDGGVLHVALGTVRFSLVFAADQSLTGDGRRKLFPNEPAARNPLHAGDDDLRWALTLKRA
jgi:hypothetical protein